MELRAQTSARGVALITVLACLVIISIILVAFMSSMTSERASTSLFGQSEEARRISEQALTLAMAQIQQATNQDTRHAWASQPGAIRVYNEDGALDEIYKLYTASAMTGDAASVAADTPSADWNRQPGIYADLNQPFFDGHEYQFPIVDPRALAATAQDSVAGFSYRDSIHGVVLPGSNPNEQRLPMPVRWLYLLADGSLVPPVAIPGGVRIDGADHGRKKVIGRFVFWTDDDTCKVNINTASHGSYWDTPRVDTTADRAYSTNQPKNREFQSYPGHPASTDLKTVFPALTDDDLYALAPRISKRGDPNDGDRLYASVHELLFNMQRTVQPIDADVLARRRFFLTAHSHAPELNLFNQPRISLWPVSTKTGAYRTAFDELADFCSTVNGYLYEFQRTAPHANNEATSIPRNWQLLQYLEGFGQKKIPGFGDSFTGSKYSPAEFRQILTEIFDYVRTTNLRDSSLADTSKAYAVKGTNPVLNVPQGQVTPTSIPDWNSKGLGRFPTVSQAFLWFMAVGGVPGQVPSSAQRNGMPGTTTYPYWNQASQGPPPPPNSVQVVCIFGLQYFDPTNGWSDIRADFGVKVEGLDALQVKTGMGVGADWTPMEMPAAGSWRVTSDNFMSGFAPWGGVLDYRGNWYGITNYSAATRATAFGPYLFGRDSISKYPCYSRIFDAPRGGTLEIGSADITIKLYALDENNTPVFDDAHLVQTLQMQIPGKVFPAPVPATDGARRNVGVATNSRFDPYAKGSTTCILESGTVDATVKDVVRGISVTHGDSRFLATKLSVPVTSYSAEPDYDSTSKSLAHSLTTSYTASSVAVPGSSRGKLVADAAYPAKYLPPVRSDLNGVGGAGDWDNGLGNNIDGPYSNKPDEGNNAASAYFNPNFSETGQPYFSPNRQVPSAVMLGSLPAGDTPWRTLQFRPHPASHPGLVSPRDHLFLDWFWMPVVEPYAISDTFSTSGKINMNYAMAPFPYITRNTGIRALLAGEKLLCIPQSAAASYKTGGSADFRHAIQVDETLLGFENQFASGDIFRSATQICDLPLVPEIATYAGMNTFWDNYKLTGDNSLERPYANLYPRLTTQSNTYTVHIRAQSLKIPPRSRPDEVLDARSVVTGEWQGYAAVERYLEPEDAGIPDAATTDASLSGSYRMRVLETRNLRP